MNAAKLEALSNRWSTAKAAERANFQSYLIELCEALGVERPRPAGSGYEFEYPVKVVNRDGTEASNFVDLYKQGHFVLEAKDQGTGEADSLLLRKAYGQARAYTAAVEGGPPPYVLVLDVGRTLLVWDRWDGSYGGFSAAHKISLAALAQNEDDRTLLRDIFVDPAARDPRKHAARVTRETAEKLAQLATSLESRGHSHELVARFLMRCVFTMFAEDVGLLPDQPFTRAVEEIGFADPNDFAVALRDLWKAMDEGSRFGLRQFLRFNGHFFKDQTVLDLTREDLTTLHAAAKSTWADVEPSIMGTLLTRALDPIERHRLGAEYTPREFVERVVRPTVEEPIRERWTAVQAEVLQLRNSSSKSARARRENEKTALTRLREFHGWLRTLRFLDPACGSGNFLYVTLAIVKQVELEVLRTIEEITGSPELAVEEVGPWQFHGIEIKAWAREIAELTLWIGYHQWWRRTHGHTQPPEPVLRDTGTLGNRDAVLVWSSVVEDPSRSRPDPTPRIPHSVTGELVPDPAARLPYQVYSDPAPAPWPQADFIVGNPPYIGNKRMREAFGDGYVEALRKAYPEVPESADYVMYWWHRAAGEVASGRTLRAGLITTNSITQTYNRAVIAAAMTDGVEVIWTVPTHPWVDEAGSAAVRVAMTVLAPNRGRAILLHVDQDAEIISTVEVERLNADLTAHADVAQAVTQPLLAISGLSSRGFTLVGRGFVLDDDEATRLAASDARNADIIRPYLNGRDLASRPRDVWVIDFGMSDEAEAKAFPVLYDIVRSRVQPQRAANKRASYREYWWRFGEPRVTLREALRGLSRFIATPYVSKHRFFTFLDAAVAPDETLVAIAVDDDYVLGVLSSTIHEAWALAAGSRLGVGNDPRYNNAACFDSFPFPDADDATRRLIADTASEIDQLRKDAIERDEAVTMTGIYNVIVKLRVGQPLTDAERRVHDSAACGVLRDLHYRLDALVAGAYGWPWPMQRTEVLDALVTLHGERIRQEKSGHIGWLRPAYQRVRFGSEDVSVLPLPVEAQMAVAAPQSTATQDWPANAVAQITLIQEVLARGPVTVESVARQFKGARRDLITRHLETLAVMGEAREDGGGVYHAADAA